MQKTKNLLFNEEHITTRLLPPGKDLIMLRAITPNIRENVARNSNAGALLEKLARDEDTQVKVNVALNASTPESLLVRLRQDKNRRVQAALQER
jgi:hypothetical protein